MPLTVDERAALHAAADKLELLPAPAKEPAWLLWMIVGLAGTGVFMGIAAISGIIQ